MKRWVKQDRRREGNIREECEASERGREGEMAQVANREERAGGGGKRNKREEGGLLAWLPTWKEARVCCGLFSSLSNSNDLKWLSLFTWSVGGLRHYLPWHYHHKSQNHQHIFLVHPCVIVVSSWKVATLPCPLGTFRNRKHSDEGKMRHPHVFCGVVVLLDHPNHRVRGITRPLISPFLLSGAPSSHH